MADKPMPTNMAEGIVDPYALASIFNALDAARASHDALLKASEALRERREQLVKQMAPIEVELRKVNEAIKKAHAPAGPDDPSALYHVDMRIAMLTRLVNGKPDPRKPPKQPAAA